MFTRISSFSVVAALGLVACAPESGAPEGVSVECALGEGASMSADCVLESLGDGAFTIHHPDNSFQRIRYNSETRALSAADGADEIVVAVDSAAGTIEFSIGTARYRVKRRTLTPPPP